MLAVLGSCPISPGEEWHWEFVPVVPGEYQEPAKGLGWVGEGAQQIPLSQLHGEERGLPHSLRGKEEPDP